MFQAKSVYTAMETPTTTTTFNSGPPCKIDCIISNARSSSHRKIRKSLRFAKSPRVPKSQSEGHKFHESPRSRRYASTGITNAIIFPQSSSPPAPLVESEAADLYAGHIYEPPLPSPARFLQDYVSPSSSLPSVPSGSTGTTDAVPSDSNGTTDAVPSGSSSSVGLVAGVVVVLAVVIVAAFGCCVWWRRKKRSQSPSGMVGGDNAGQLEACSVPHLVDDPSSNQIEVNLAEVQPSFRSFTYDELRIATKNFSSSELLGSGGSGHVYRGTLPDGSLIAVKRISDGSKQGMKEFKAEVTIISRVRHVNLVKLRGSCDEDNQLFLVYELLSNGSLDNLLFNNERCVELLSWSRRFSIMEGLGSALRYLHDCNNVIIHRDVKCSNVLLDENFVAKLGDFGLSRQVDPGMSAHSTLLAGTTGYMAPEIFSTGKATTESDVYSYGVVLAEVACGRRAVDGNGAILVDWVWDLHSKGMLLEAADERLAGMFDEVQMRKVLILALACTHPDPKSRHTMRLVTEALNGNEALPSIPPSKPIPHYAPTSSSAATSSASPFSNVYSNLQFR